MGHRQRRSIARLKGQTVVRLQNRLLSVAIGDCPTKARHAKHRIRCGSPINKYLLKSLDSLDVLGGMESWGVFFFTEKGVKKNMLKKSACVLLKGLTDICFCFCVHSLLAHSHLEAQIEVAPLPTV